MPSPNQALGTPENTHGENIPVGVEYLGDEHIPTYWGDEQILSESNVYSKPKLPDFAPLHIPRVVRFLYGYSNPETPVELDAVMCGCTSVKNCPNKDCTWVLVWKSYEVSYVLDFSVYPDGFTASQTSGQQGWSFYPHIGTYPDGVAASTNIKIWASESDFLSGQPPIYTGGLIGAPGINPVYVVNTRWHLECVDPDTQEPVPIPNGCFDTAGSTYAIVGGSAPGPTPTCTPNGKQTTFFLGTTFGTSQFGVFTPGPALGNIFTVQPTVPSLRNDYPVEEDFDGMCIDEEYPCGGG